MYLAPKNIFYISLLIFISLFLLSIDFGLYKSDYYLAHSITMNHLHEGSNIIDQIYSIPNSASGVLPLWIYGFFNNFYHHKLLSFMLCCALFYNLKLNIKDKNSFYLLSSLLLLSPSFISSAAWSLPEIFTITLFVYFSFLNSSSFYLKFILSVLIPFCRQTFFTLVIIHFLESKNPKNIFFIFGSLFGIFVLYLIWGGLVPPSKIQMHQNSFSLKSLTTSFLIISLYFLYYSYIKFINSNVISKKKIIISLSISAFLIFYSHISPPLEYGGFIFSRLEKFSSIFYLFEFLLLVWVLYFLPTKLFFYIFLISLTLSTSNFIFVKYIDFLLFSLIILIYIFKDSDFILILKSFLFFQLFSLSLFLFYFYIKL